MASYKLFDSDNNEITLADLQDKGPWCRTGASFEQVFVEKYGTQHNLIINPAKVDDIYAPDLQNTVTGGLGDLKTQNTPFFQAESRFGLDPQYTVTFNVKDFKRYTELYPGIEIYFWVKWLANKFEGRKGSIVVPALEGVWKIGFDGLTTVCNNSEIHTYAQRIGDKRGNARDSYVLDLNDPLFTKIV